MGQAGVALLIANMGVEVSYGLQEIDLADEADRIHNQYYIGSTGNHFHPRRPYVTVVEGVMWG